MRGRPSVGAVALLVTAWLTLAACSGDGSTSSDEDVPAASETSVAATSSTVVDTTNAPIEVAIDPSDPRPILTMSSWSFWIEFPTLPDDLPILSIYPDGRVVRIATERDDLERTERVVLETSQLSQDRLEDVVDAAVAAGLVGGEVQPRLLHPDEDGIVDGDATVFSLRDGDRWTTRVVNHLYEDDGLVGERVAFAALRALLPPLFGPATGELAEPTRWAITETGSGLVSGEADRWTGPALVEQEWVEIGPGVRCTVVEMSDWVFNALESGSGPAVAGYGVLSRRPLLPHEDDCADVAERRNVLGL